jgi:hypothetical protein
MNEKNVTTKRVRPKKCLKDRSRDILLKLIKNVCVKISKSNNETCLLILSVPVIN